MRMFLRKSSVGREPLTMSMSGVRMGERLLQIGVDDPALLGALASRVGVSGHAAVIAFDERTAARARDGAAEAGALVEIAVTGNGALPFERASFDVAIVNSSTGLLASLDGETRARVVSEVHRVVRGGGRVIVIEAGARSGLRALLSPGPKRDERYEQAGGSLAALESAGFRPVRLLADRDGLRFIEGLKPAAA